MGPDLVVNAIVVFVMQKLKKSELKFLSWFHEESPDWLPRVIAAGAASLTAIGIHWQFADGTLVISGLDFEAMLTLGFAATQQYIQQFVLFKLMYHVKGTNEINNTANNG